MTRVGPLGRPPGIGYRQVTQIFQTAGTTQWVAPCDIQDWTGVDIEVWGGGADGGNGASPTGSGGSGGGSGGGVKGTRRGFVPGQTLALVVGLKASTSSVTIPTVQGGNMTATGGTGGSNGSGAGGGVAAAVVGGAAGTGSGAPTDQTTTGQPGADSGPASSWCGASMGGYGGDGGSPIRWGRGGLRGSLGIANGGGQSNATNGQNGTGRGSGGGGGGGPGNLGSAGTGGTGQPGIIIITVWTQDPNYLDKVA